MVYGSQDYNKLLLQLITNVDSDDCKHRCYTITCSHADDMSVHLYGQLPIKILNRVRPREDPETKAYRISSYESVTKSTADKGLSIVSKIFNPSLYSIRVDEGNEKAKQLADYALKDYPYCNSVINYVHEVGLRKMIADPNAIYVIKPSDYPDTELQRIEPIIKIYGSKNIWIKDNDNYTVYIKTVPTNGAQVFYFEYYDENKIIEFWAYTPNQKDLEIGVINTYSHNFGEIPAWELKGNTEVQDDGTEVHKSFFDPAISFWNKAINHESDLDGAYINHMHPIRVELAEECDFVTTIDGKNQRCRMGLILNPDDGKQITCPSCNGSGYKSVKSPYGVYRVDHQKLEGDNKSSLQPVSYVTVPTDATKMLEDRVEKLLEKGLEALNMDVVNKIGENQSGKAKVIDRGELYDFLYKISSVVFDTHVANIFKFFNLYMFGVEALNPGQEEVETNLPNITKPVMFDITTAVEMVNEYKNSKDAGLNPHYLRVKQMQLNSKEFASDEDLKCLLNLILECDPLPQISEDTIIAQSLEGWYAKYDPIIHANIEKFVRRAIEENPEKNDSGGFENMTSQERYKILIGYAKEVETDNKVTLEQQPQLDANGQPIKPDIIPGNETATNAAILKTLNTNVASHVTREAVKP